MKILLFICSFLPAFLFAAQQPAVTQEQDHRIVTIIHTLEQTRPISEAQLSPDGKFIAWKIDGGFQLATLGDLSHSRRITACSVSTKGEEEDLVWSPDSSRVAFFSNCTPAGKTALFIADSASDGVPRLITPTNGFASSLQWSPDGMHLSFLYVEGTMQPSGSLNAIKPRLGVIGDDESAPQRIALIDSSGGAIRQITPETLHVFEYDWSHDSKKLTYTASNPPGEHTWWFAKLYAQELFGPASVLFDPGMVSGSLHGMQLAVPRWSPDGSRIAFIGGLMSDQGYSGGDIYIIPFPGR